MRAWAIVVVMLVAAPAAADSLAIHDPEAKRPDLAALTVKTFELHHGKSVEASRELRTYDKAGQVTSVEYRRGGKMIVRTSYVWSGGHLAKRVYREASGRIETRTFTYKLDASDRVIEMTMRDPNATGGEHYVTTTTWNKDGSRDERTSRHYTDEGPYEDGSASYDAAGRLETRCSVNLCEMYEYDGHGNVSRVRQQHGADHDYLVYELTYDAAGRLEKTGHGSAETTFGYDARGDVVEEHRADGSSTVYVYRRR